MRMENLSIDSVPSIPKTIMADTDCNNQERLETLDNLSIKYLIKYNMFEKKQTTLK